MADIYNVFGTGYTYYGDGIMKTIEHNDPGKPYAVQKPDGEWRIYKVDEISRDSVRIAAGFMGYSANQIAKILESL